MHISVKCEMCYTEILKKRTRFIEIDIDEHYSEFKNKFNIFRKLEMTTDEECINLITELEECKDCYKTVYKKIYCFLNTYPNYRVYFLW